ncbi:MAG: hypothetical protein GWP91_25035, partial [Rhodobacterales bacterium]|nr:hypothetical protein [Rhodobacterales bacterium]
MEAEIFDDGVMIKHLVSEDDEIPPGYPIAIWGASADEDITALLAEFETHKANQGTAAAPVAAPVAATVDAPVAAPKAAPRTAATTQVERTWMGRTVHDNFFDPTGDLGIGRLVSRVAASPLARKIAADRGVALERLNGTGPGGRIVKADVENAPTGTGTGAST